MKTLTLTMLTLVATLYFLSGSVSAANRSVAEHSSDEEAPGYRTRPAGPEKAGDLHKSKSDDGNWVLRAKVPLMIPFSIFNTALNFGTGFLGTVGYQVWRRSEDSWISMDLTTGFLYQFGSGEYYDEDFEEWDADMALTSIPILLGVQTSFGSSIQIDIASSLGLIMNKLKICEYGFCSSSDFEASLAWMTEFGLSFDVSENSGLGVSVGLLWIDIADDDFLMAFMMSASLSYDL